MVVRFGMSGDSLQQTGCRSLSDSAASCVGATAKYRRGFRGAADRVMPSIVVGALSEKTHTAR